MHASRARAGAVLALLVTGLALMSMPAAAQPAAGLSVCPESC
jgi:hypothetical protein